MKVWLLTSDYNEYDQHGEYFEDMWLNKPTVGLLKSLYAYLSDPEITNLLSGFPSVSDKDFYGGRSRLLLQEIEVE